MRRVGVLIAVLAILLTSMVNPWPSHVPAATVTEPQMPKDFGLSADGSESDQSIELFAETSADNTMTIPDACTLDSTAFTSGKEHRDSFINDLYITPMVSYVILTFDGDLMKIEATAPSGFISCLFTGDDGVDLEAATYDIVVYVHNVSSVGVRWSMLISLSNGTLYTPFAWNNNTGQSSIETNIDVGFDYYRIYIDDANEHITFDYVIFTQNPQIDVPDSSHFLEDFAGVSDWTTSDCSISTDGDLGTITENGAGSTGRAYTSFSSTDYFEYYYEFRIESMTATTANLEFWDGAAYNTLKTFTAAGTYNGIISDTDATTMQRIGFLVGSNGGNAKPDYLRIGNSTSMGWQHDGSTTAGVSNDAEAGFTYSASSDSDIFSLNVSRDSGSGATFVEIRLPLDTTSTYADIERDYYQFWEAQVRITRSSSGASTNCYITLYADGYNSQTATTITALSDWTTLCMNHKASTTSAGVTQYWRMGGYLDQVDEWICLEFKYVKIFSIANFTYTGSGVGTDDYLYVDSGVLHSHIDDGYIELNHDPALSVSDTYSVYNLTTSGTVPEFSQYVSSWSSYSDDTRGATTSGTLTDIKLKFDSTESISAIKFIEDSTAPDADIVVSPDPPDDDEQVTLSSIVFDDVEVWKVWYNAISYPSGFSDVDYEATEGQENFWSYSFSSLIAGDYCFKVIANDGANNNTITQANRDYATTRFTVRESAIVVEEITLIGAGSDFTMMQFSARINKDCSYVIYEESENNAEAATHSGSVSEPSFNLAWAKLSTTDTNVNFTIKFTNGTLTYNYTSQYQVAQTVLSVTSYDWGLSETQVTLSYQTSKSGTYTLYLDDVQEATSSFVAGSNFLNWSRPSAVDPAEIDAAMRLSDGTTTIWLNQTYSEYSLTAFSIQTLFMDLTDPSISAIFTTSWGNATGYLYEADVQKATGAEGTTLSYTKSTTAGTYNVALKIDAGGEVAWYNTTYTVAVTTLQVTDDSIRTTASYAYLTGHVNLDSNYKVYEETVEVGSGSVSAGSLEIRWTKAANSVENVTVLFESGSQSYNVYSGYDVAAQVTFVVESWWMDLNLGVESYVEFYVLSSFENATVYVYDNNTLMTTVTESAGGAYSYFWLSESEGLHIITLNITHGATVHTRTRTYYVPDWAATGLVMRWDIWTFQDNYTMISLESNWKNCTFKIFMNDSLVATSYNDPVTLNFTRNWNIGEYNLTIHADGGAETYSILNIRYIITEEGVTYDYSSVVGGRSVREGDVYVYEGDDVVINENPPGIFMTAETAATIAVSTVFIFFLAVLFMNYRVKKAELARDKKENR